MSELAEALSPKSMYSIELNITGAWIDYSQYFNGLEEITTSIVREDDAFGNKVLREKADIGQVVNIR